MMALADENAIAARIAVDMQHSRMILLFWSGLLTLIDSLLESDVILISFSF